MKTRAIAHTAFNRAEVVDLEIPPPGENEVLIESSYSCISPGTELRCLTGIRHPREAQKTYEELMDRNAAVLTFAFKWH